MANKLVIVLVLYQEILSKTPSYLLLKQLVKEKESVHLLFYDNSPSPQEDELFSMERVCYIHDETNPGLAKAYNVAARYLNDVDGDFLLLLDQDTELTQNYLEALVVLKADEAIGAYVPLVLSKGRQLSPVFSDKYIDGRSEFPLAGSYREPLMAINSGTMLPKQTIQDLAGFNLSFPLDYLDHWLFWKIHQQNKKIDVLDFQLEHDLSVLDYRRISVERYESIISAETLFYSKFNQEKFITHRRHLLFRTIKQFLKVKNRKIWRRTFVEWVSLMKGK